MHWLVPLLVNHPYIILLVIALFSGTCLIIPLALWSLPNFMDPQLGFETRGTAIAQRLRAWNNLNQATSTSGPFVVNPAEYMLSRTSTPPSKDTMRAKKKTKKPKKPTERTINYGRLEQYVNETVKNATDRKEKDKWNLIKHAQSIAWLHNQTQISAEDFFCGNPENNFARFVVEANDMENLFDFQFMMKLCYIERQLAKPTFYNTLCHTSSQGRCCRPWSLTNYIAKMNNRASCLALTEDDVITTRNRLSICAPFYHNHTLTPDCSQAKPCNVTNICVEQGNAVYYILHYLTDVDFLLENAQGIQELYLRQTMIFLPIACSTSTLPYYHELNAKHFKYENVKIVAMDMGLRLTLFDEYLMYDTWLIGAGVTFIFLCMWLYTESIFLTLMTILAIAFSLGISYFIYTLVFQFKFFPFMNLLAIIVTVGIGADDAFIFCKIYRSNKIDKNCSNLKLMANTLNHAAITMFVTSFTTAAAFFSSCISSITAIGCFGIFAGIAVIANFFLMITWLPACVVISEQWIWLPVCIPICKNWERALRRIRSNIDQIWTNQEQALTNLVINFRYYWLALLTCIAVASAVVVLYHPKLKLPDSPDFQLFSSSHPFEKYEMQYKHRFQFEHQTENGAEIQKLPLRFVWGILPVDNGNYFDPYSKGTLVLDDTFDVVAPESQIWLLDFCRRVRGQPFYQSTMGPLLQNCFIEFFKSWMERTCIDTIEEIDRTPCCNNVTFPYTRDVFDTCILQAMTDLYRTPSEYLSHGAAGPKFSKDELPTIKAVVIEYDSKHMYTMSHKQMYEFYYSVETWMQEQLKTAPPGLKNGWFVSELEMYDLQEVLSQDTLVAIGISMAVSFCVLLLVTLNIPITVYVILTITLSIFVTMALLVLLGWKLNVLESTAVSTTFGLTVDFSLHYGVTYRHCHSGDNRINAAKYALTKMAGPTVMAAITTGAAGALMLPSNVLAYIEIGTFLVIIMAVSWLYSTFYLGSLLAIIGPEKQFGQFSYPSWFCKQLNGNDEVESEVKPTEEGADPKPEPATSTTESHELESLTTTGVTKPYSFPSTSRIVQRPVIASKTPGRIFFPPIDQSPSGASAITMILVED